MAQKGVCTSPNGVAGCTSPTCPGGSFNANLETLRFNNKYFHDAGLNSDDENLDDERESVEIEIDMSIQAMFEDYMLMSDKDRRDIFEELNSDEKQQFEQYLTPEDYNTLIATMVFNDDQRSNIVKHYLIAALWTAEGRDDDENTDPDIWNINNIAESSIQKTIQDVDKFIAHSSFISHVVNEAGYGREDELSTTAAYGHDLYLTRNHEGVGFWDREGLKNINGLNAGQILTQKVEEVLKPVELVKGDDGKLHFE